MSSIEDKEQLIPRLGLLLGIVAAVATFSYAGSLYGSAVDIISAHVKNGYLLILVKTVLFFTYLLPIGIGLLLINSRYCILQVVGMIVAGLGFGIVVRIALIFVGILDPYT